MRLALAVGAGDELVRALAAHAGEVRRFARAPLAGDAPSNAVSVEGNPPSELSAALDAIASTGRGVDLALLAAEEGQPPDVAAADLRRSLTALLDSPAVERTAIALAAATQALAELAAVRLADWPKVRYVDWEWVPAGVAGACVPGLAANASLALIVAWPGEGSGQVEATPRRQAAELLAELAAARADAARARAALDGLVSSASWRITAPLRAARARLRSRG